MSVERHAGDDIPLLLNFTDSAGVAINIDNLAELYVFVIHATEGTVLAKFSKAGAAGYTALEKITTLIYRADIKSSITKTAALGPYKVDINVVETDTDYESSQKNTIGVDIVFKLKDSYSKVVSSG